MNNRTLISDVRTLRHKKNNWQSVSEFFWPECKEMSGDFVSYVTFVKGQLQKVGQ